MNTTNKSQLFSFLSMILALVGTYLTSSGKVTPDQWSGMAKGITDTVTAVVALVGVVMLWWNTRPKKQVQDAAQVPGVQVHVDTTAASPAPSDVQELALTPATVNPKATDVIPMGPGGPVPTGTAAKE